MTVRLGVRDEKIGRQTPGKPHFSAFNGYGYYCNLPDYIRYGGGGGSDV